MMVNNCRFLSILRLTSDWENNRNIFDSFDMDRYRKIKIKGWGKSLMYSYRIDYSPRKKGMGACAIIQFGSTQDSHDYAMPIH